MTTGRLKGQAFVTFTNIQRAQQALNEVNGYVLYDRPLVIVSNNDEYALLFHKTISL